MWAMFDATLLVILLSPVLYFFVLRPLMQHISERKQAEEETELAYAELNQIFNTAADGMRLIDKDFNVLRVNETFSTLSGVSRDEATGKKCYEVFRGPMCFKPDCPLTRILGGEKRVENEVEKERKDGTKIPCIVTGTPFRGPDGKLIGIVEDFKDITTHKQAREALRAALRTAEDERLKSKSIIESIGEPLGIIDTDFRFVYQNKVHRDSFGEHLGKLCYKAIRDRDEICEGCQLAECFRDGNIHTKERVVARGEGPPLYVVNTASPLRDSSGKIVAGIELIRDITEWRLAEEALRKSEEDLKKRVKELEEFYQMAVGRELKMVELKNEIESLKEELSKYKKDE
jgi:PAS domain S-box-containing protein